MTLLVTSTGESTGKTAIALALARAAADRGLDVGYMKPLGTRLRSTTGKTLDEDPLLAVDVLGLDDEPTAMEPVVYSPTFVQEAIRGHEDPDALADRVRERFAALSDVHDALVLEGGGSLNAGGIVGLTDRDLADLLDATVVLVVPYEEPRDVDEVLAAAEMLGDRLGGVLFNVVPDAAFDALVTDVVPFLESRGVRVYGSIPRDESLAGVTVAELGAELGAEVLTDAASTDALIQRFVVGAMTASEALGQLRSVRDAALITGGDRSDVVSAALEATGISCIVLTGGLRPSRTVLGRAESADVPVLLVRTDTKTTIDRAEAVVSSGRTRDADTVARMGELLDDYADVDAMLDAGFTFED